MKNSSKLIKNSSRLKPNLPKGLFSAKVGIFLILPILLIRLFTGYYPLINNLYYSFTNYSIVNLKYKFSFISYLRFFSDTNLKATIIFTLLYTIS